VQRQAMIENVKDTHIHSSCHIELNAASTALF
jgi:hypothetical protein